MAAQPLLMWRWVADRFDCSGHSESTPGERHGLRRFAARLDFGLRQMRWMDHYLKGDVGGEGEEDELRRRAPAPPPPGIESYRR